MNNTYNIVFEGGGIKGLAYIGALQYLESRAIVLKNFAGSSVGALFAALSAAGFTSNELKELVDNFDYKILKYKNKKIGLHSLKKLEEYLEKIFQEKNVKNFKDFKVGNNYKLKITTTSLKLRKNIIIPDDLDLFGIDKDSFSIAKAICMSCAIPLFYDPVHVGDDNFYDGGLSDNFPYQLYCSPTLGFRIGKDKKIVDLFQRTLFKSKKKEKKPIIITIDTTNFKATDFENGYKNRYILYNRGFFYTRQRFLCQKNNKGNNSS